MRNSATHGADFVVLSMFFGDPVRLRCAVVNWLLARFTASASCRIGATDHLRHGAPAVPDLPGARHNFHRPCDADRRRRDGRDRRVSLARFYGCLTWELLRQGVESSAKLSALVVFILIGARVFWLISMEWAANLDRRPADIIAWRPGRFLDLCQRLHFRDRVFPRFFRTSLHHYSDADPPPKNSASI